MSIPYNENIPFSTHNPSVDQPNMLINTNSIASFVAIDHVPFNTSGSGQHEQVTFNSNNVPGTPTAPPVLFTNTIGSLPQLFFYSGSTFNQYVNTANGSTYLLGGIIMKWGNGGAIGSVNFPVAFPNGCYAVLVGGTSSLYDGAFAVTTVSASAFTVVRTDGHSDATGYYYIAIGY